jgi:hypothetical protein
MTLGGGPLRLGWVTGIGPTSVVIDSIKDCVQQS